MKVKYKIMGMTCEHCVMKVTQALESVEFIKSAKVSLKKSEAIIKVKVAEEINFKKIEEAVKSVGYEIGGE
ncbi:MAG: heavy-metal-associated domain-containing protein [Lactovum sp.]